MIPSNFIKCICLLASPDFTNPSKFSHNKPNPQSKEGKKTLLTTQCPLLVTFGSEFTRPPVLKKVDNI